MFDVMAFENKLNWPLKEAEIERMIREDDKRTLLHLDDKIAFER